MTTTITLIVLVSALMHASWNYLIKAGTDKLMDTVTFAVVSSGIALIVIPFVPAVHSTAWTWLGLSVLLHIAYFVALIKAYQLSDLSLAYPVMRGVAPMLVTLASLLMGKPADLTIVLGVTLITLGVILPAIVSMFQHNLSLHSMRWALGNSLIIATYTLVDAQGVQRSGNAVSYTAWLFFLDAWGILLIALYTKGNVVLTYLGQRWRSGLLASGLSIGSYGVVLWAMTVAPVPAVAALRESSVIFAAFLGGTLLKERDRIIRLSGAFLVAAGAMAFRLPT